MADEEAEAPEEEAADGEEESSEEAKPKKQKKEEPKKGKGKLIVILVAVLVLGVGSIAGIYFYNEYQKRQLAEQWGTKVYTEEEKAAIAKEKKITKVVETRKIKREYFDECNSMSEQYTTPKGWNYSQLPLRTLLGLSKYAVEKDVENRCVEFAQIVEKMETVSKQKRHVFLCKDARFELSGGYFFDVDPGGQGIRQGHISIPRDTKLLKIEPGKNRMYSQWQFYNVGDGCIVVGYSKMRGQIFTMGADIVEKKLKGR